MNNDLISRTDLKEAIRKRLGISSLKYLTEQEKVIVDEIDNAPTVYPAIEALEIRSFDEALSEDGLFPVMVTKEQFAKIRELSDKGEL